MHLTRIGIVHSPFKQSAGTPAQSWCAAGTKGQIEVFASYVERLRDLEGFQRIWILASSPESMGECWFG